MSVTLRPYQSEIIAEARSQLIAGKSRVLVVSPTGSGKTSLTAQMIASAVKRGKRAWFTCHRSELVRQSVKALQDDADLSVGIIAAGFPPNGFHPAQVCSIQTLMKRWEKYPLPDLLVADEAHHLVSKSWSSLLAAIVAKKPDIKIIGLTATPTRLDGRGLKEWFQVMVQGPTTAALIEQGFLSKFKMFAPSTANLDDVHTVAGDFNKHELDEAMRGSKVVGDAVGEYKAKCDGKRALMFLWSVQASEDMAAALNAAGVPAAHVDGKTGDVERARAMADFRAGRLKVLTNCELFGEGLDVPSCFAGFFLRPTQSLSLCLQQYGRVLRPDAENPVKYLFDHAGNVFRHGMPDQVREWSLDGLEGKAKGKQESPVRQCGKCFAVLRAQVKKCSECGYVFEIDGREVQQLDGELKEIDLAAMERLFQAKAKKREQGMASSIEDLKRIEKERGYKPGWAKHVAAARTRKVYKPAGFGEEPKLDGWNRRARRLDSLSRMADQFRPKRKDNE